MHVSFNFLDMEFLLIEHFLQGLLIYYVIRIFLTPICMHQLYHRIKNFYSYCSIKTSRFEAIRFHSFSLSFFYLESIFYSAIIVIFY